MPDIGVRLELELLHMSSIVNFGNFRIYSIDHLQLNVFSRPQISTLLLTQSKIALGFYELPVCRILRLDWHYYHCICQQLLVLASCRTFFINQLKNNDLFPSRKINCT